MTCSRMPPGSSSGRNDHDCRLTFPARIPCEFRAPHRSSLTCPEGVVNSGRKYACGGTVVYEVLEPGETLRIFKKEGKLMFIPQADDYCSMAPFDRPQLIVVIDTEEEFDWSQDFAREHTAVQSTRHIHRVQEIFDIYGIIPVYAVDYPIVSQPDGYQPLLEIYQDGRCLIGAHLHPWVSPPFEETVNRRHSFPGNLPEALEARKLQILGDSIGERFGSFPLIYKAGRYGLGPHTAGILEQQGYQVDVSICPQMHYTSEGGPDFSAYNAWPFWFGQDRRLLEIPLTVGYTGLLRFQGAGVYTFASHPVGLSLRAPGILARLGLLNKIWLSPEGYTSDEHRQLTRTLYHDGLRIFTFAFHSPSVEPGHTPYVKSKHDLEVFLESFKHFFDFFIGELGGEAATPLTLKAVMEASNPVERF